LVILSNFLNKNLLGQELSPQAWIESFSGNREKMWRRRDATDGDVISPILSKVQPPRQLRIGLHEERLDPVWFSHVSQVVSYPLGMQNHRLEQIFEDLLTHNS